jgi:hypothetical protein
MTWYHPNYYKKLRDLRRQASGNGRVGPRASSSKKNKSLDSSGDMGYCGTTTAAGDTAVIGNGNGPTGVSSTRALRDPGGNCILKMSRGDVTWSCQGYGKSKSRVLSSQADKQQAAGRGRVGPKGTSCQASGDSRINKR